MCYRTEEIQSLLQELKTNEEKLKALDADIFVMNLQLGITVEDAKPEQGISLVFYMLFFTSWLRTLDYQEAMKNLWI